MHNFQKGVPGWVGLLFIFLWATPAWGNDLIFSDKFDRSEGGGVANGWFVVTDKKSCRDPDLERKTEALKGNPLFREISEEILKNDKVRQVRRQEDPPTRRFIPKIQGQQLFLHYQSGLDRQAVERIFVRELTRLEYDFTPLYIMGGVDDHGRFSAVVEFFDQQNHLLGRIRRDYYNNRLFDDHGPADVKNYVEAIEGAFDGQVRHAQIDIESLMLAHLPRVDPKEIAKTKVIFEVATDWCNSAIETMVDNVAVFAASSVLFSFSAEELHDMFKQGLTFYHEDRRAFPANWVERMEKTHGRAKIVRWLKTVNHQTQKNPARIADLVQQYGIPKKDLFAGSFMLQMLLDRQFSGVIP
ncbi:hypothetical protein ACQZV8_05890 [Magnetococcales bacterium HHB-1]